MKNNQNLRFLLALGGKKVIVLRESNTLSVYADERPHATVDVQRIFSACESR